MRNYPAYKVEFLTLKLAVTDQFHEYLYGGILICILIIIP